MGKEKIIEKLIIDRDVLESIIYDLRDILDDITKDLKDLKDLK